MGFRSVTTLVRTGFNVRRYGPRSAMPMGQRGSGMLTRAVTSASGVDHDEIAARAHRSPADRSLLAKFTPIVTAVVPQDPEARRIAATAADAPSALTVAVAGRLGPLPGPGVSGGVFSAPTVRDASSGSCSAQRPLAPPHMRVRIPAVRPREQAGA
jgi:hypothetical protein